MCGLEWVTNDTVLTGLDRPDDAGVIRVRPDLALIQTLDFFTPIVDDPRTFGRIAAANSLSDVYAMGGTPISAMNIVCFPADALDMSILTEIMAGGLDALREADCPVVGGHSVDDPELKYGLSVTGTAHPDRVLASGGARPGDALVLTKAIGTALVTTAEKRGHGAVDALSAAVDSMSTLNRAAAEAIVQRDVHACTDVTGFALLGHAHEMVADADVHFVIDASSVPVLPRVREFAEAGHLCGGLARNREHFSPFVSFDDAVPDATRSALFDPQTSGGLLAALPPDEAAAVVSSLVADGHAAAIVGRVEAGSGGSIRVVGAIA